MKTTNDLVDQLSAAPGLSGRSLTQIYAFGLVLFELAGASIRSGYFNLVTEPVIALKQLTPLLVAITSIPLGIMLLRPEARLSFKAVPLVVALLILPILAASTLVPLSEDSRSIVMLGDGFYQCLTSIVGLSIGLLTAQILVLRRGAVTQPGGAGAVAGLAAGAISAIIYAFICTEDSPGFYGLWYSVGILISGFVGALVGKRFLKW
jgi:hypothetical protein